MKTVCKNLTNTNRPQGSHRAVAVEVVNDKLVHLSWMLLQQEVDLCFLLRLLFQFLFRSSRTNQHTHIRLKLRLSTRRDLVAVRCFLYQMGPNDLHLESV